MIQAVNALLTDKAELREKRNKSNRVQFHFNPESITFEKEVQYTRSSTDGEAPHLSFAGSKPLTISNLKFMMDEASNSLLGSAIGSNQSVMKQVTQLLDWMSPADTGGDSEEQAPPTLEFFWKKLQVGPYKTIECKLKKVSAKYTMFNRQGKAIRAEVMVSLEITRALDSRLGTNPTLRGPDPAKAHTVQRDESLPLLAHQTYGRTAPWRQVADYNAVDNPFRMKPGESMLLPEIRA